MTQRPLSRRIVGIVAATALGVLMWAACCAGAAGIPAIYDLMGGAS